MNLRVTVWDNFEPNSLYGGHAVPSKIAPFRTFPILERFRMYYDVSIRAELSTFFVDMYKIVNG